jgi:hypothetical protein
MDEKRTALFPAPFSIVQSITKFLAVQRMPPNGSDHGVTVIEELVAFGMVAVLFVAVIV